MSPTAADALARNPQVAYVEADMEVSIAAQEVPTGIERIFADSNANLELDRISGRARSLGLTAAERRVAELAAAGRSNREIAADLFLAVRTVETHLSHVYAKLGISSRVELARRLPGASVEHR